MKKILSVVVLALMLASVGCAPPKPEDQKKIVDIIRISSKAATKVGFDYFDKKDHKAAVKTADEVNKAIVEVVLPYLNGEAVTVASFVVSEMLQEKFFDKLDVEIKLAIISAATILDIYISPPDPTKKLTKEELDYMKAFFEGVASGTDGFGNKLNVTERQQHSRWFK
jgi:hypothetical protein